MIVTDAGDVVVLKRNELNVALEGGRIKVGDSDGKGGGNVRSKGGHPIQWTNRTAYPCRLVFWEFLAADDEDDPKATWPFREAPVEPPNVAIVGAGAAFKGTLRKGGIEGYVKYDIVVETGANPPPSLDPIIIIDK
jgi:hypothetical protein